VLKQDPESIELVYDAYNAAVTTFSLTDRLKDAFCAVAVYRDHVNLSLNYGALLPKETLARKRRSHPSHKNRKRQRTESPGRIRQAAERVPRAAGSKTQALAIVKAKEGLADIINVAIEELIRLSFELPGFTTIQEEAQRGRAEVNHSVCADAFDSLGKNGRERIDRLWVEPGVEARTTAWNTLKQDSGSPTLTHFQICRTE
jgi:hypothetical protein